MPRTDRTSFTVRKIKTPRISFGGGGWKNSTTKPLNQEITTALAIAKRKERSYNIGQT